MHKNIYRWVGPVLLCFVLFAVLVLSPSFLSSASLSDISGYPYEDTITFLSGEGVVQGYSDGTFRPDQPVNRVEFLKIVVGSTIDDIDTTATNDTCGFTDTVSGQWYIPYLCRAVEEGIVSGYPDGTFKPEQAVNFVEAAKIATRAYGQDLSETGITWYAEYANFVSEHYLIPPDLDALEAQLTRGQVAEFLGRYLLDSRDELSDYLGSHDFDYAFFDLMGNTLVIEDNGQAGVGGSSSSSSSVLSYADLLENPIDESVDDWSFSAKTGGESNILTHWHSLGSDGLRVDFANDETETTVTAESSEDYGLAFIVAVDATFAETGSIDMDEDTDLTGTLAFADADAEYDWSENRVKGSSNMQDSFSWEDDETESYYERSISDGTPSESFLMATPESEKDDDDQSSFINEFDYDSDTGGIENWLWQSEDASLVVNQVMKDEFYTEFLGYSPSDQLNLVMQYDQYNVAEALSFTSTDGKFVLDMEMSNDDFDETMTYDSSYMSAAMSMTDLNILNGTVLIESGDGDSVSMTFEDNVLQDFVATVEDDGETVQVDYVDYGSSSYLMGLLVTETSSTTLFTDEGMAYDGTLSTDEISVTSSGVSLSSGLLTLDFDAVDKVLEMDWDHSASTESETGTMAYDGGLKTFDWTLKLGDEDAYNNGSQSGSTFKWYKGFELGLDPNRLIKGKQDGGIKGKDIQKDWTLKFDPEDASLDQTLDIDKDGFKKTFDGYISLSEYLFKQQMELRGKFKGFTIGVDSDTTAKNGELKGTTSVTADNGTVSGDFDVTYGTGKSIAIDGSILVTPVSGRWTFGSGVSVSGGDITVKPHFDIPLVDGDDVGIDLSVGGNFDTHGNAQGTVDVNITEKTHGLSLGLGATVDEGGKFGGSITAGAKISF